MPSSFRIRSLGCSWRRFLAGLPARCRHASGASMRFRTVLLYASFLLGVNPVQAADHVWIVGGGPNLGSSQAQIELNVNWVIQVLNSSPGARQLHIYYTDGNA